MVKVIKNNAVKRCACENCNSLLEYSTEDIKLIQTGPRKEEAQIYCPACNKYTKI